MDRSPFWKLSAELRNYVYDLASTTPGGVFIELIKDVSKGYDWRLTPDTCHPHPLASKEMREETLGAFHAVNSVSLIVPMLTNKKSRGQPGPEFFSNKIKRWLHALHPKQRGALKTIELDIGTWNLTSSKEVFPVRVLAAVLFDIAKTLEADGLTAIVWITLSGYSSYGLKPLTVSFRLSAVDVFALRTAENIAQKKRVDEMKADWSQGAVHLYDPYIKLGELRLLGDALERMMG